MLRDFAAAALVAVALAACGIKGPLRPATPAAPTPAAPEAATAPAAAEPDSATQRKP